MEDAFRVRGHESRGDAARDVDRLVVREPSDAAQQAREVLAVDVLHGHEVRAFPVDDVVDAADVRMRDLAAEAHFVVQAAEQDRVAREPRREKLQRHGLIRAWCRRRGRPRPCRRSRGCRRCDNGRR